MASIGVEWWTLVVQSETDNDEMERENEREESESGLLFDLMSPRYSAGHGWSEPFNSGSGRRRDSWRERSEDEWYWLTCSAWNWWSRLAPNDAERGLQAVQFGFEFEFEC